VMSREDAMSAAWVLLGYARAWMGQDEGFLSEWPVPPVPDGEQAEQWTKLAQFCAGRGDWSAAERYLTHATEQYPGASAPWLVLCDLAIARNNAPAARQHLVEAEKRNAPQEELAQRRAKLGGEVPVVPAQPGEVVIR